MKISRLATILSLGFLGYACHPTSTQHQHDHVDVAPHASQEESSQHIEKDHHTELTGESIDKRCEEAERMFASEVTHHHHDCILISEECHVSNNPKLPIKSYVCGDGLVKYKADLCHERKSFAEQGVILNSDDLDHAECVVTEEEFN